MAHRKVSLFLRIRTPKDTLANAGFDGDGLQAVR
jgi:hypothetical protein